MGRGVAYSHDAFVLVDEDFDMYTDEETGETLQDHYVWEDLRRELETVLEKYLPARFSSYYKVDYDTSGGCPCLYVDFDESEAWEDIWEKSKRDYRNADAGVIKKKARFLNALASIEHHFFSLYAPDTFRRPHGAWLSSPANNFFMSNKNKEAV